MIKCVVIGVELKSNKGFIIYLNILSNSIFELTLKDVKNLIWNEIFILDFNEIRLDFVSYYLLKFLLWERF